jgi:hypothetical protein
MQKPTYDDANHVLRAMTNGKCIKLVYNAGKNHIVFLSSRSSCFLGVQKALINKMTRPYTSEAFPFWKLFVIDLYGVV